MSAEAAITNDDLQAFADSALTPPRRDEVAAYVEKHPEAASYVEAIVSQNAALRAAAKPMLDPDIPADLRVTRLFERERVRSFVSRGTRTPALPQIAAALVAGLLVGGIGGWSVHPSLPKFQHGVRPLVEEAADTYSVYEPDRLHPVEIAAADKDALMRWAANRLRRPVTAPDSIGSYKLLGGRVVATTRGPAAMFMYETSGGRRIVLMICPLSLHTTSPIVASAADKLTGVSWSDQGVGYSLVGPICRDELERLGKTVRQQVAEKT